VCGGSEGGAQEWGKKLPAIVRVDNGHDVVIGFPPEFNSLSVVGSS
jgi:hypothetical protein